MTGEDRLVEAPFVFRGIQLECLTRSGRQTAHALQVDHRFRDAGKDQPVTSLQTLVRRDGGEHMPAPLDFHQVKPRQAPEAGLSDTPPAHLAVLVHGHFHRVLPWIGQGLDRGDPVREQPRAGQQDVDHPGKGTRDADQRELEKLEAIAAGLRNQKAVDDEIRAGADNRAEPAQDRGERQRHQESGRRKAGLARPFPDGRDEGGDHRSVVDEGAHGHHRQHHSQLRCTHASAGAEQVVDHGGQCAGFPEARRDNIEGGDRQHALVGEAGQALRRSQYAQRDQRGQRAQKEKIRSDAGKHEPGGYGGHRCQGNEGVEVHRRRIIRLTRAPH